MIRILTEGIRRGELLGMAMSALPDDLIRNPVIRVVPLKGARASGQGRLVLPTPSSARAFAVYLRVRRSHRLADSDWVWLGTRNRGQFSTTGVRKMLIRRAAEAGYGQVTPHQFRHTFSHDWLVAGGSEGDLMRLNGWERTGWAARRGVGFTVGEPRSFRAASLRTTRAPFDARGSPVTMPRS
jgi:integrase